MKRNLKMFPSNSVEICPRPLHHSPGDVNRKEKEKKADHKMVYLIPSCWPSAHCTVGASQRCHLIKNPAAAYLLKILFPLRFHLWKDLEPGESNEGQCLRLLLFLCFFATMRLHSMLKTQTTFTMGAPQQGGATWGAAAVPIVRSRTKREKRNNL